MAKFVAILNWWLAEAFDNAYSYSAQRITKALAEMGVHAFKSNTMHYVGIRIKSEVWQGYAKQRTEDRWRMTV